MSFVNVRDHQLTIIYLKCVVHLLHTEKKEEDEGKKK